MDFVSLHGAIIRINPGELDVFAEVVSSFHAQEAFSARDAGFDSYSVT